MTSATPLDDDVACLAACVVLYVEDDTDTRVQMAQWLGRRVATVITARDGVDGLRRFREAAPDFVITDVQMPKLDGLGMVREIRALDPSIPVIVTTAFEHSDYFLQSIELGIDRYVVKPVVFAQLEGALLACSHRLRAERVLQLRQASEVSLRHHQMLGVLAAGMAHDYNNLLQGIIGNVSFALELAVPGTELHEILHDAHRVGADAGRLGQLLKQVATGGPFERVPVAIEPMLRAAVGRAIQGAAVTLAVNVADGVPLPFLVPGDATQLGILFEQLAKNAVDAMPQGGTITTSVSIVTLPAQSELPLDAGDYARIALRDTGPGFPQSVLPDAFEPYVSTKDRGTTKGMGLGLTIARSIALQHGGYLSAADPQGGGAELSVYLPLTADGVSYPRLIATR